MITTVLFLMPVPEQTDSLINDKLAHALIFLLLSFLIDMAYREYKFFLALALVLLLYGTLVELLQGWVGYRSFSFLDLAADAIGISFYAVLKKAKLLDPG